MALIRRLLTLAVTLVAAGLAVPPAPAKDAVDHRAAAFRAALQAGGFSVKVGNTYRVDPLELVNERVFDSALGNNAGQPYKAFNTPGASNEGTRLAPYEAIVYLGPTPPAADYFSFVPMLFIRHYSSRPIRDWLAASVGDPLNDALIKTEGRGGPFKHNTMVIFTADRGIYNRVAEAALSAGYPASMLNLYTMPSNVLHLGTSRNSDAFEIIIRTANFHSQAAGNAYLANDNWGQVFRITPRTIPALDPLPQQPWRARDWRREKSLVPGVTAALERLRRAILARTPHSSARQYRSVRWFYDSRDVLLDNPSLPAYRKFVAGESSDTPYLRTASNGVAANFRLGLHDRVVVYGVNHVATGLATYSSFGVYGDWKLNSCQHQIPLYYFGCGDPIWNGVVGMTNHVFTGSARRYLPHDPLARYLYAVTVVRTRSECPAGQHDPYCVVVPQPKSRSRSGIPSAYGIDLNKPLMIGYRAYLNAHTHSGPSYRDIIPDRSILFGPTAPPVGRG